MSTLTTSSTTQTFNILQDTAPSDCPVHVPHAAVCVWQQLSQEVKCCLRETPALALRKQTSMSDDVRSVIEKFWVLTWHVITTVDPPTKWTQKHNVRLHLALREHAACKATVSLGQINFTRIVNDVLYGCTTGAGAKKRARPNPAPLSVRLEFAQDPVVQRCSRAAVAWLEEHNAAKTAPTPETPPQTADKQRDRQALIWECGGFKWTKEALRAVQLCVLRFLIVCSLPLSLVRNWALQELLGVFRVNLPRDDHQRTAEIVDELCAETATAVDDELKKRGGPETLVVDGKTDETNRQVTVMCRAKLGCCFFHRLVRKKHGLNDLELIKDARTTDTCFVACDNAEVRELRTEEIGALGLIMIACAVHTMDLCLKDAAKLSWIATIARDVRFVVKFITRRGMLRDELNKLCAAAQVRRPAIFSATRFAGVAIMFGRGYGARPQMLKLMKTGVFRQKQQNAAKDVKERKKYQKFQQVMRKDAFWERVNELSTVLSTVSDAIHFLSGDDIPLSIVIPVYFMVVKDLEDVQACCITALELEEIRSILKMRWLSTARRVGMRQDVHCAAWRLDFLVRALVAQLFGATVVTELDNTFEARNVYAPFLTLAGEHGKEIADVLRGARTSAAASGLVVEYPLLKKQKGRYGTAAETARILVAQALSDQGFNKSGTRLARLCTAFDMLREHKPEYRPATLWEEMEGTFAHDAAKIVSGVAHVCGLERQNKDVDMVYTRTRTKLSDAKLNKLLYIKVNQTMLRSNRNRRGPRKLHTISTSTNDSDEESIDGSDDEDAAPRKLLLPATKAQAMKMLSHTLTEKEKNKLKRAWGLDGANSDSDTDRDSEDDMLGEDEDGLNTCDVPDPVEDPDGVRWDAANRLWPWNLDEGAWDLAQKPASLQLEHIKNQYITYCFKGYHGGFRLGKVKDYSPQTKTFEIVFEHHKNLRDDTWDLELNLAECTDQVAPGVPGTWAIVKPCSVTNTTTSFRSGRSDPFSPPASQPSQPSPMSTDPVLQDLPSPSTCRRDVATPASTKDSGWTPCANPGCKRGAGWHRCKWCRENGDETPVCGPCSSSHGEQFEADHICEKCYKQLFEVLEG